MARGVFGLVVGPFAQSAASGKEFTPLWVDRRKSDLGIGTLTGETQISVITHYSEARAGVIKSGRKDPDISIALTRLKAQCPVRFQPFSACHFVIIRCKAFSPSFARIKVNMELWLRLQDCGI